MEQNRSGTVVDYRGRDENYRLPNGEAMPVPRQIDIAGTNVGSGTGDDHATQDTQIRRSPTSHPALR
jgi:hypothetical protein